MVTKIQILYYNNIRKYRIQGRFINTDDLKNRILLKDGSLESTRNIDLLQQNGFDFTQMKDNKDL